MFGMGGLGMSKVSLFSFAPSFLFQNSQGKRGQRGEGIRCCTFFAPFILPAPSPLGMGARLLIVLAEMNTHGLGKLVLEEGCWEVIERVLFGMGMSVESLSYQWMGKDSDGSPRSFGLGRSV